MLAARMGTVLHPTPAERRGTELSATLFYLGWGTMRMYGSGDRQPSGYV